MNGNWNSSCNMMIAQEKKTLDVILDTFDCPNYYQLRNTKTGRKVVKAYAKDNSKTDDELWDEWKNKPRIVYIESVNAYVNPNNPFEVILTTKGLH